MCTYSPLYIRVLCCLWAHIHWMPSRSIVLVSANWHVVALTFLQAVCLYSICSKEKTTRYIDVQKHHHHYHHHHHPLEKINSTQYINYGDRSTPLKEQTSWIERYAKRERERELVYWAPVIEKCKLS